ncbi:MAG: hypothetical protein PHI38_10270, partial [Sulfurimonas sp.]|uniref:hypothetical protein n=1 Tax=Sulfurimonas sp. TaxID=2022749 RepID=UPI002628266E
HFDKSFNTFDEAIEYIQSNLHEELKEIAKNTKNVETLKESYRFAGTDYFIKGSLSFSSWEYVEQNASRILDEVVGKALNNVMFSKEKINCFEDLLVRGNLPDDPRVVPNYLKIKNAQYDDVDFLNNTVDELIKLDSEEFNELVSQTDNGLLFTWLSTLSDVELQRFYDYNDKVVKLENGAEASSKEQFEKAMESINKDEITDTQRARATLQMPLAINYAKEFYIKTITFRMFRTYDYFKEYQDEKDARFEVTLSNIIWDEMKYIPEYFEQVLTLFRDFYDEKSEYHQKIFKHLATRFGALIATLNRIASLTQTKQDSINWFTGEMIKNDLVPPLEISVSQTKKLENNKKLINFLTLMYAGICEENEEHYISNLIEVVYTLFEWYPANSDACEYALKEMMKSVALKNVSVESANRFLEFFEDLPRFYKVLSYEKIMNLKELINHTLATYKPLDNKIFKQKGVKNRLIVLNYKIDMEDLYYESTQDKIEENSIVEAFFKNSSDEQIQEFLKTIEMERFVLLLDDYPPFVKQRVLENVTHRVAVWIEDKIQRARENPMDADAKEEFINDMEEIIKKNRV